MNKLERFLKSKRLYSEFKRECENQKLSPNFKWIMSQGEHMNPIPGAILYRNTKRGYDFWRNIDKEYDEVIYQNQIQ